MDAASLDEETLQQIYTWIDGVPLSRPKRNITRDFSDGVLVAEILHHFLPKIIDLHNYAAANSTSQKTENWNLLSRKVFSKIGYHIPDSHVKGAVSCKVGVIELILRDMRQHLESYLAKKKAATSEPRYDDYDGNTYVSYPPEDSYYGDGYSEEGGGFVDTSYATAMENGYNQPNGGPVQYDTYQQYDPQQQAHHLNQHQPQPPHHQHYPVQHQHPQHQPPPPVRHRLSKQQQMQQQQQYDFQSQPHVAMEMQSASAPSQPSEGMSMSPKHQAPVRVRGGPAQNAKGKQMMGVTAGKNKPAPEPPLDPATQLALGEKDQQLLAAQETVQILQAKVRRLEHLLHLKDLRIADLNDKLQAQVGGSPKHLPPQQNFPRPPTQPPQQAGNMQFHARAPLPGIPRSPAEDGRGYQR